MTKIIYNYILAIGSIVIATIFWTLLTYPFGQVTDTFTSISNTTLYGINTTLNVTAQSQDVQQQFTIFYDSVYISLFVLVLFIFLWVIRKAVEASANPWVR